MTVMEPARGLRLGAWRWAAAVATRPGTGVVIAADDVERGGAKLHPDRVDRAGGRVATDGHG